MSAKAIGRFSALLAVSLVVGLVLWSELARRDEAGTAAVDPIFDLPTPPEGITTTDLNRPEGITDIVERGRYGVWTNNDPEFGLIRMRWDSLDPRPNGLFDIEKPHATVTLETRRLVISADEGTLLWPARGLDQDREPESGTLRGNVRVMLFEGVEELPDESPAVTFETETLAFDSTLGEIKAPGRISIETDRLAYSGNDLSLRYSQSPWELTTLRVREGNEARLVMGGAENGDQNGSGAAQGESQTTDASRREDFYSLTARDNVRLVGTGAELLAGVLRVDARLVGGELPSGAIAEFRSTLDAPSGESASGGGASKTGAETDDSITLAWDGPLEIRPSRERPSSLSYDDLHLSILSDGADRVVLDDSASGASLVADSIEYGATSRRLALIGAGDTRVVAGMAGEGQARFERIDLDLNEGLGTVEGPIELRASPRGNEQPSIDGYSLSASEGASLRFDTRFGPVGAGRIIDPVEAILHGRVEGSADSRRVTGDGARAMFTSRPADSPETEPRLARLLVTGDARIEDLAREESISAETLDLSLDTDAPAGELVPRFASARGSARASRGEESLGGDIIEATFSQQGDGQIAVTDLRAVGNVIASNGEGTAMETDLLESDESTGLVYIEGEPIRVTSDRGGAVREFAAPRATFDRNTRVLTVIGPGEASQDQADARAEGFDAFGVTWAEGMVYDEPEGTIDLTGGVRFEAQKEGVERHTASAQLATVRLSTDDDENARLLGVDLEGASEGENAIVEFRRFAPGEPGETRRLASLRGPRIELDASGESVRSEGPGTMLVHDTTEEKNADEGEDPFGVGGRGSTLFEWDDSVEFDRLQGRAEMRGRVRVVHRALGSREATQITCDTMIALLSEPSVSESGGPTLVRADALGTVFAKHGSVEIRADQIAYLASEKRLIASAGEGKLVNLRDQDEGREISAEAVSLDLVTGDWNIEEISPVTSVE